MSRKKKIAIGFATTVLAAILFSQIDLHLCKTGHKPLFAVTVNQFKDGGTTTYSGLGYQIIDWNRIEQRNGVSGRNTGIEFLVFPFFKDWGILGHDLKPGIKLTFEPYK